MIDYSVAFVNCTGVFPAVIGRNVTAPGAGDGTEWIAAFVNDVWGRAQALLDYAGLSPDGVSEAADTAQILTAIGRGFAVGPGIGVDYWKNGAPAANGDRVLLLQGQVILIASYPLLAAAVYVGNANNATAPAFYKTSDAGGTTRDTAGTYMVLPDHRGLVGIGVGNATISGRTKTGPAELGEVQEDQGQSHLHPQIANANSGTGGVPWQGTISPVASNQNTGSPVVDGAYGTPRMGAYTRVSSLGHNYGITY